VEPVIPTRALSRSSGARSAPTRRILAKTGQKRAPKPAIIPATGSRLWRARWQAPADIQYAATCQIGHWRPGVLGRPVKPDDDAW